MSGSTKSDKQEADKFQMEFFKQMGTFSLAGTVLMAALYGAFAERATFLVSLAAAGTLLSFTVSLVAAVLGMYVLAQEWGAKKVAAPFYLRVYTDADKAVDQLRAWATYAFLNGTVGFFLVVVGITVAFRGTLP